MNLKQFSALLGLSQTTVSRALNGYPEVRAATRERVIEAARRHGYRANPSARRLATGRAEAVGLIFPTDRNLFVDPHMVEFLGGLGEGLTAHEMDIFISPAPPDGELAAYRRIVTDRRVDALIVSGPLIDDERVRLLHSLDTCFLLHGRTDADFNYAFLDIDNEGAFRDAANHLIGLGHRRIGLINGNRRQTFAVHRETGYLDALRAHGIAADPALIRSAEMSDENGDRAARALLDMPNPPTAFLCASMLSVLGCLRAIRGAGLEVGRDISVIAHDDGLPFLNPAAMHPPLTTTHSPIRDAGRRIADLAIRRIAGECPGDISEVWPVELVLRASTAPARTLAGAR